MKELTEGLPIPNFESLMAAIDEAAIVAVTDQHGVIIYANKKFCAISQYSASELIGKTHNIINSKFHSKEFFENLWKTISSGKIWEGEIRNKAKDGSLYWVNTTIVPFLDNHGNPERYVAVRYDITERKLAEEQLKIYAQKLEVSNQELTQFASIAAHDLQEPLRKILSFSDRAKIKAKDTIPPDALDYLERVQSSAKRMQQLITDLLTYSRVTTKAQPFKLISLEQILKQVCSDLEIRLEQTQGRIDFRDLPSIEADPTQMHQLFLNIIANALKFHKNDIPPRVYITAEIKNNALGSPLCLISIKDNGIGFEKKYSDRIFTIFQRLHGRNEYEGTGIGLAICRKIVDRHGGTINVKSILGEGSTFIITLPVRHET